MNKIYHVIRKGLVCNSYATYEDAEKGSQCWPGSFIAKNCVKGGENQYGSPEVKPDYSEEFARLDHFVDGDQIDD